MAINKKGYRKIEVRGETFLWRVRKKVSHEEGHADQLPIPVQHDNGGQLLFVFVDYSRAGYKHDEKGLVVLDRTFPITPSMIRAQIELAIESGWEFDKPGQAIALVDGKLNNDVRWSKMQ